MLCPTSGPFSLDEALEGDLPVKEETGDLPVNDSMPVSEGDVVFVSSEEREAASTEGRTEFDEGRCACGTKEISRGLPVPIRNKTSAIMLIRLQGIVPAGLRDGAEAVAENARL